MITAHGRYLVGALLVTSGLVVGHSVIEAQGLERCTVADIHWTFGLPDGSLHGGGRLRICLSVDYTPSAGLHVVSVDQRPVGMFMSRVRSAEQAGDTRPVLLFRRAPHGDLVLAGFVWPDTTRTRSFELYAFGPGSADRMARVEPTGEAGDLIRLAARFD